MVYAAAALGVVYCPRTHSQRYYQGHADDVVSVDVHPGRLLVATGELTSRPAAHVWNVSTLKVRSAARATNHDRPEHAQGPLARCPPPRSPPLLLPHHLPPPPHIKTEASLVGYHLNGITLLKFSRRGTLLASIGIDAEHSMAVHEWQSGEMVGSGRVALQRPLALAWAPDDASLCVVGVRFATILSLQAGTHLAARPLRFGNLGTKQVFTAVAYVGADPVVGTGTGQLYRFRDGRLAQVVQLPCMNEPVLCMAPYAKTSGVVVGSADGLVTVLDGALGAIGRSIDLAEADEGAPLGGAADRALRPAVVSVDADGPLLLVGARSAEVYEFNPTKLGSKGCVVAALPPIRPHRRALTPPPLPPPPPPPALPASDSSPDTSPARCSASTPTLPAPCTPRPARTGPSACGRFACGASCTSASSRAG